MFEQLEVVFADDYFIAINKPHDLLVHRSPIAKDAEQFAVQLLRDQVGYHVFPAHRLDRKTGGVLLFARQSEFLRSIQPLFANGHISKTYLAVVRGFTPDNGTIDYPLTNDKGIVQEAVTDYVTLERVQVEIPFGKHTTSRYSLVKVNPKQGRMHQIRKHFAHIYHPVIADRPHGCNKQNKLFKEKWNMATMLLHAHKLEFVHPHTDEKISIEADLQAEFKRTLSFLNFSQIP